MYKMAETHTQLSLKTVHIDYTIFVSWLFFCALSLSLCPSLVVSLSFSLLVLFLFVQLLQFFSLLYVCFVVCASSGFCFAFIANRCAIGCSIAHGIKDGFHCM